MTGARGPWPALFTSTSMRPQLSVTVSTSRLMSSFDRFDPVSPIPPRSFARASPLPEDDRIATRNPSAASRRATPAPIPLPPADTTATLSIQSALSGPPPQSRACSWIAKRSVIPAT